MQQAVFITFWLAMACYAGATVLYAYFFVDKRRPLSVAATFLTGAGFLFNTAAIGLRSITTHGTELTGPNSLVLAAWALVLVYFFVEHVVRLKVYGVVLVPIAAVMLVLAQLLGANTAVSSTLTPDQMQQLASWQTGIHVALVMLANAAFAVGAVASIVYLLQEKQLKKRKVNILFRRLPALAQTDGIARRAVAWGFPVYSAGLLLGTARAMQLVPQWWLDPRVMLAGVTWLIFALYLVARYIRHVPARSAAWLAIVGFVAVVVLGILARTVPTGFHIFGLG